MAAAAAAAAAADEYAQFVDIWMMWESSCYALFSPFSNARARVFHYLSREGGNPTQSVKVARELFFIWLTRHEANWSRLGNRMVIKGKRLRPVWVHVVACAFRSVQRVLFSMS